MTGPSVPALAAPGSLARSIQLFQAFRVEQTDPDFFYSLLARDSVREVQRWCPLAGSTVLDVGGGPGYFADAFAAAGARYAAVDPDAGELTARGGVAGNTMRASGLCLPFADGAFDVTYSSNVLEHVPQPEAMLSEMVRVTRPGGTVVVSWTPWLSPWGGHETSPWHYLGGVRAADRYAALGHALTPRHLVVRSGTFDRRRVVLAREGVIGVTIRESFFQRRAGLATVTATTAVGRQHYDAIDVPAELSTGLAADLLPGPFAELLDAEHVPQPSSSDRA